jgi:hypothetical protein
MKKALLFVLLLIILIILFIWLRGCITKPEPPSILSYYCDTCYKNVHGDTTQQIIVWRQPNSDDTYTRVWLDSIKTHCGKFKITLFCGSCDSSLMLLTGPGIATFITSNGGTKSSGSNCTANCKPQGDSLYWCVNYPVDYNFDTSTIVDSTNYYLQTQKFRGSVSSHAPSVPASDFRGNTTIIAVFDTGVEPGDILQYLYNSSIPSCLDPSANNGWNFYAKNNIVNDDYHQPYGHGEFVSRLIVDQAAHYKVNNVNILPVKTHDSSGNGDLFGVLCGFAYAKERGAQIINASFGYYSPKVAGATGITDPNALLIKKYIQYYLTNNHILLIAAAGNKKRTDDGNLDDFNFYPASLAADPDLSNVIAVTTVSNKDGLVSPTENYSDRVVDIGVNGDLSFDSDYYFAHPEFPGLYERGSSFATPVLTGIIGSHYDMLKSAIQSGNKTTLFNALLAVPSVGNPGNFNNKLRYGVVNNNRN